MSSRDILFSEWLTLQKSPRSGGISTPLPVPRPGPYSSTVPVVGAGKPIPTTSKYSVDPPTPPQPWIDDVDSLDNFFSPQQPVWPQGGSAITRPWEWDYPSGYNLNYIPARMEMMGMLKGMARTWGVLATIIATRMDQLLRVPFTIQRIDRPRQKSVAVDEMKKFFRRPDGKLTYGAWARKILDDLLVLDAPAIYFARDRAGRPLYAEAIAGQTIFPLIDDVGRRPDSLVTMTEDGLQYLRRQPAFQQIIKGMPLVDLDESELMYVPMRPRPELPMFGYPPTEEILVETSEAIRKTFYQANFWASGTIPDLVVTVPDTWSPRQIASFQAFFDAMMTGNMELKSKVRFLPGGMKPFDIKNSSGESLWSQRDETLIRLACFAYSVSPTPFIKQVNRSTAQQSAQASNEEGLFPLMSYWKNDIMDPIIQDRFGYDDIEFSFQPVPESNAEKLAKIHQIQLAEGLRNRNEIRTQDLGFDPIPGGDTYTIELRTGIVPLEQAVKGLSLNQSGDANSPGKPPVGGSSRPTNDATIAKLDSAAVDRRAADARGDVSLLSPRQLAAGNYRKGHIRLHGLDISIENAYGQTRGNKRKDGSLKWSTSMPAHYGYIRGTVGADGEQMDVFIGRRPDLANKVFVIDQMRQTKKGNTKFDEHKVMLGYKSTKRAMRDYLKAYGERKSAANITALSMDEFKQWLKSGSLRQPLAKADTISTATLGPLRGAGRRRKKHKRLDFTYGEAA